MPNLSPRYKGNAFAAVGSLDTTFERGEKRNVSVQFVGSGNFEASLLISNDPAYTAAHYVDVTSTLFGVATITAVGFYPILSDFLPEVLRVHVTSIQAAHTIKAFVGH